jgi:hypothetical protein
MMADTPRDHVYLALFNSLVANENRSMPTGAVVPELIERVDADEETVRDVLRTMDGAGVLVERTERGHLEDSEKTCSVYYTAPDGPLGSVGATPPQKGIHEPYDEETIEEIRDQLGL